MIWLLGLLAIFALQVAIIFLTIFYWIARITLFIFAVTAAVIMTVGRRLLTR